MHYVHISHHRRRCKPQSKSRGSPLNGSEDGELALGSRPLTLTGPGARSEGPMKADSKWLQEQRRRLPPQHPPSRSEAHSSGLNNSTPQHTSTHAPSVSCALGPPHKLHVLHAPASRRSAPIPVTADLPSWRFSLQP